MPGFVVRATMWAARRGWRHVDRLSADPASAQRNALLRVLKSNQESRFGVEHGFGGISSPSEFRTRVPVQQYETLRPYIDDQRRTGARTLTSQAPVFYAQTSGTTGQPKYIPITSAMLAMQQAEQRLFSYLQYRACPAAFEGRALGVMGAAVEDRLDTGHAVGSVSGHLYGSLPRVVRSRFVVPPEVLGIADYELKYATILRLALGAPDITYLGSPNPTTFLRLLEVLNGRRDELIDAVASGQLPAVDRLAPEVRRSVADRIRPAPERAAALRRLGELTYATVWPEIQLVTTWTGGSCGIALQTLRGTLPVGTKVMELGYQSSECRGTIALAPETPEGLPPLHHHYFEFVEPGSWEAGRPEFLGLQALQAGRRYYVLFTTIAGLYRYFINDLVEVCGFHRRTPLLRFVQKGKGVTSLTGEKLYEAQVVQAVGEVADRLAVRTRFFVMVADEHAPGYTLFVEWDASGGVDDVSMAAAVERRLGELNIEYQGKRASGRLRPLAVATLRAGASEAYKAACVRAGQREVQFKPSVLQYKREVVTPFADFVEPRRHEDTPRRHEDTKKIVQPRRHEDAKKTVR